MTHSIRFPLLIALLFWPLSAQAVDQGGTYSRKKHDFVVRYKGIRASEGASAFAGDLLLAGQLDKAEAFVSLQLSVHPGDFEMRNVGFQVAFLLEKYTSLEAFTQLPPALLEQYPELEQAFSGWIIDGGLAAAAYSGVPVKRDRLALDGAVMKQAEEQREKLPFGMVTEEGIITKPEVLVLALLMPSFQRNAPILLKRIVKLAPNDTFVLELQARDFERQQKFNKQVEYLKKAVKGKISKERAKRLQLILAEAQKRAAYHKILDAGDPPKGDIPPP